MVLFACVPSRPLTCAEAPYVSCIDSNSRVDCNHSFVVQSDCMGGHVEMWYAGMRRCMLRLWAMSGTHMQLGGRPHPLLPAGAHPLGAGVLVGESPPLQEMTAGESQQVQCQVGCTCCAPVWQYPVALTIHAITVIRDILTTFS